MGIKSGGQNPGNLGPPFNKRQIRHNSAQGFKQGAPYDVRTGKHVPLIDDPKDQVALLKVLEIHTDYLICKGLNPYTGKWMDRVLVAKPYLLQITPFDGEKIRVEEKPVTDPPTYSTISYVYDDDDKNIRTATTTDSAGEVTEEVQVLKTPFFIQDEAETFRKDEIAAIRTTVVSEDGSQTIDYTGLIARDEDGNPLDVTGKIVVEKHAEQIEWLDLNTGGRRWTGPYSEEDVGIFVVRMEHVGGEDGDSEQACSWRYTVREWETPKVLDANLDPVDNPHIYVRPNLGMRTKATHGLATYNEDGDLVMISTNEEQVYSIC